MVNCYICGLEFEPRPEKLKAWAEAELPFEPTDWECPDCINNWDDGEDDYDYGLGQEH
jgi:rubredoxin